jgi:hypothetical protein
MLEYHRSRDTVTSRRGGVTLAEDAVREAFAVVSDR